MTIPEAAAYSVWTIFKIRTLCHSGELRYSQEGHPFLITRKAIQDCIVLLEAKTKAKREARLAKLAHKKKLETNGVKPAHRSPCGLPGCLALRRSRGGNSERENLG
jgi:hypothetical protein